TSGPAYRLAGERDRSEHRSARTARKSASVLGLRSGAHHTRRRCTLSPRAPRPCDASLGPWNQEAPVEARGDEPLRATITRDFHRPGTRPAPCQRNGRKPQVAAMPPRVLREKKLIWPPSR